MLHGHGLFFIFAVKKCRKRFASRFEFVSTLSRKVHFFRTNARAKSVGEGTELACALHMRSLALESDIDGALPIH
jgi:hypothetical protein